MSRERVKGLGRSGPPAIDSYDSLLTTVVVQEHRLAAFIREHRGGGGVVDQNKRRKDVLTRQHAARQQLAQQKRAPKLAALADDDDRDDAVPSELRDGAAGDAALGGGVDGGIGVDVDGSAAAAAAATASDDVGDGDGGRRRGRGGRGGKTDDASSDGMVVESSGRGDSAARAAAARAQDVRNRLHFVASFSNPEVGSCLQLWAAARDRDVMGM